MKLYLSFIEKVILYIYYPLPMQCLPFPVVIFILLEVPWIVFIYLCFLFGDASRPCPITPHGADDAAMALPVKGSERLDGEGRWEGKTMAEGGGN